MSDLYICPKAHEKFTPVEGLAPPRPNCSKCGKPYLYACGECGEPYEGDDSTAKFHGCGAKIPWARDYAREAKRHGRVTMDYWEIMADQANWQGPPENEALAGVKGLLGGTAQQIFAGVAVLLVGIVLATQCGLRAP